MSFNKWLSEKRAATLVETLRRYVDIPDSIITFEFLGRDWKGLRAMCEADTALPYRAEVLPCSIISSGSSTALSPRAVVICNASRPCVAVCLTAICTAACSPTSVPHACMSTS